MPHFRRERSYIEEAGTAEAGSSIRRLQKK